MNTRPGECRRTGYMMVEALVYIGASALLLGIGLAAMYRCIDNSVGLRRSADDLVAALHAGERWRADLRTSVSPIQIENLANVQVLYFSAARTEIRYRFAEGAVYRRVGSAPWTVLLTNVLSSVMEPDSRSGVMAWRWELELKVRAKTSRIRPLFTFTAAPARVQKP